MNNYQIHIVIRTNNRPYKEVKTTNVEAETLEEAYILLKDLAEFNLKKLHQEIMITSKIPE